MAFVNSAVTLSFAEMISALMERKAAAFVGIESLTEPKMVKDRYAVDGVAVMKKEVKALQAAGKTVTVTANPFWGKDVQKRRKATVLVNFHYAENVQKRLERENAERIAKGEAPKTFDQGESWHELVKREDGTLTPFCKHKQTGVLYLRCMDIDTQSIEYTVDGAPVDAESIKPFLQTSDYKNQGLDEPLVFLCYSLTNLKALTLDGQTYVP